MMFAELLGKVKKYRDIMNYALAAVARSINIAMERMSKNVTIVK